MPCCNYDALLLKFLQSFPTRFDAKLGQHIRLGVPLGDLDLKGEMGDVAEDEGTLALGGDGQALMAGGVARCRDDGDFVGEVEVALHQPEVVQLLEELANGLGLVEDFYGWVG